MKKKNGDASKIADLEQTVERLSLPVFFVMLHVDARFNNIDISYPPSIPPDIIVRVLRDSADRVLKSIIESGGKNEPAAVDNVS